MKVGGDGIATISGISRHSSRRAPLDRFLAELLQGATGYDRIAGYFSSSILEVAGEALEAMPQGSRARVIANSDLDPLDVLSARAAKQAMTREWKRSLPEDIPPPLRQRLERLAHFLTSGRLHVRVLPDAVFGLIHGKAGVIRRAAAPPVAFMGSANESRSAWTLNYEIVWTDESPEGVAWVQEEFDALWNHPQAVDLAEAVVQDVQRLTRRVVVPGIEAWKASVAEQEAAAAIELPIYRREDGLWAHQKWFVREAFERHKAGGARLVLADQVGLGKTVQLALAAKLMALWGGGNVLALAPKPLLVQWRDELWNLLRLPSAIWTGAGWVDEREVFHPAPGIDGLRRCPRRFGLVSTGLVRQSDLVREQLAALRWECVILDEAHHARRRNLGRTHQHEAADANNLLRFVDRLAPQTRSLLLATATPVQLDPIEAWDLLHALNLGNWSVLGTRYSRWETRARDGLALVQGRAETPAEPTEVWEWLRDPFPPAAEDQRIAALRRSLSLPEGDHYAPPQAFENLRPPDRSRVRDLGARFFTGHNPYIRHVVRRTREFLENEIDPTTNEPYLKPVRVRLFGERDEDAVALSGLLRDAYQTAEEFCEEVGKRPGMNSGFLKTILLRRVGSTIVAGQRTARKMLGPSADADDEEEDVDDQPSALHPLTAAEEELLRRFLAQLDQAGAADPKYQAVERILLRGVEETRPWIEEGCIIFSQYYDSAFWVAERLSQRLPDEPVALYAGSNRSGIFRGGVFARLDRNVIKEQVSRAELRILVGTDAASEGLNLQKIGTLINIDLPWNPTRLEQRKGRIQRIGQVRETVLVYNMRYRDSVEDRVHELLSGRLEGIRDLFGQIPDTLEDVWVLTALREEERALEIIDEVPERHPFELRYDRIEPVDWESCGLVLDTQDQLEVLMRGWS